MSPTVDISEFDQRCYKNTGNSTIGVVKLREWDGRPHGIPVEHGDTVWLNEIEERLTRNAPRRAEDNPFANGDLTLVDSTQAQAAAVEETPTPVEPSDGPDRAPNADEWPEATPEVVEKLQGEGIDKPPAADLPTGAIPASQPLPTGPQPGSLDEAALEAAAAAKASGEAPTSDSAAPEKVAEQIEASDAGEEGKDVSGQIEEETAEDHTAETGVAVEPQGDAPEGTFKSGEEVATPDAPAKSAEAEEKAAKDAEETGDEAKPNFARKNR